MKKYFFLITLILTLIISCASSTNEIKDITVNDLQLVLKNNKNTQLVDVRTPDEWAEGVIENAIKINVTATDFESISLQKLDKEKPVYIYCRSGGRSKIASEILSKKGFHCYNVLGGYMAWKEKNN
ncbi:rhodanese-like domain-containing protein [Tenacibaculum aestuariivivum]|uniref:rhodanese-like domain-containing protein n=1 Tax=Tenacibaculum aestuariivivum TaxID=2006131 RepID=UPI003AB8867A